MQYRSTRGHPKLLSFEEAVLQGLAPDGGLYIPTDIPVFPIQTILSWANLPFHKLAFQLYRPYISQSEIPDDDLLDLCFRSFATFSDKDVTPLKKLPSVTNSNFWVLELFHGPTFAFKDVALQFLGNLFDYFLKRKNLNSSKPVSITVVGATSGDTGGAAIYGLRGKENINVFILHPHKRISPVQEQQMTSVLAANVHNIALEGSFDDCQDIVKSLFGDKDFKEKYQLGAINSINWARILAQTTYYFYSFFQVLRQNNIPLDVSSMVALQKIQYSVPSGNFGDVLAGFFAKQMGLPIDRFIVATNENDILDRFLKTGKYDKQNKVGNVDPVKQTLSPAMDILISSNFERLLWYLIQSKGNGIKNNCSTAEAAAASATINDLMNQLRSPESGFTVPEAIVNAARQLFVSHRVTDEETTDCIRRYYHHQYANLAETDPTRLYILDPHTAVGVVAAEVLAKETASSTKTIQTICLSTASPGKFPDTVLDAINNSPPAEATHQGFIPLTFADIAPKALVELEGLPQRFVLVSTKGNFENGLKGVYRTIEQTLQPLGQCNL
ncbi:tryptophan synthase beta subunit-like PLP-dependent enzyme [Globomyces pollinis-pini]|nr:tryptophan synthase beta subunit-like PLP-dependent enzyme [Globomyces pollinis-pini]